MSAKTIQAKPLLSTRFYLNLDKETNSRSRLSNLIYDVGPLAHWSLLEDHQNEFHLLSLLCEHLYGRTAQEIADAGPSQVKKADSARKKRQKSSHKCAAKSAVIEEGSDGKHDLYTIQGFVS